MLKGLGLAASGAVLAACAQPTPQVIEKIVEKPVEKVIEKPVVQTQVVEKEKIVEKQVEKVVTVAAPTRFKEAPMLAEQVKAGKLPSVDKRLPETPLILDPVEEIGKYGGTWRAMDTGDGLGYTMMTIATESLAKWKRDVSGSRPNVVQAYKFNDTATELTLQFRKGIKWSDGEPFTANDYLWWWNEMVLNEKVGLPTPAGYRADGKPLKMEKVDDYTVKLTFAAPTPLFVDYSVRGYGNSARHLVPSHYLKQFHPSVNTKYPDAKELLARYNNPLQYIDRPVIWAWKPTAFKSADSLSLERNPYFWKVDPEGNQLPYIDKIEVKIAPTGTNAAELILLRTIAGELDCQVRDYPIKNVSVLKENEKKGDYRVMMWNRGDYAWPWIILYYDYPDKGIVDLMYDQRFRQALSYAINRNRINEVVSLGLAKPRQAALSPESPEFQTREGKAVYQQWERAYADYDPKKAAGLLDEAGVKIGPDGKTRVRPDGKPLELIVTIPSTDLQSIDAMELVKQDWQAIGLKVTISTEESSVVSQKTLNGEIMIRGWGSAAAWGLVSATPVWAPNEGVTYAVGGARIGLWYQTGGKEGVAPRPGSMLETLLKKYTEVITTVDPVERQKKLLEAYKVHIEGGPISIGTVGEHPSPLAVKNKFRNVPTFGLVAGWDLSFPGTADPEQFFWKV
jgi:peptide/nickel transport system substrate-binding protein